MMRLDDAANAARLEYLMRRVQFAPKGEKEKRQAELEEFNRRLLRQDVSARRKGRRRK